MKLPNTDKPLFDIRVPSMNKNIKIRPFVVKEEKILLIAQQSGLEKDIIVAIKQVLSNCIQDPSFDVDSLTTYDLEYMFLKHRARSVNNIIEVSYRDNEDDVVYDFKIDLDTVEMLENKEINNRIAINDEVGIIMKMPSVTVIENAPDILSANQLIDYLIHSCIEQIYDADTVYLASDCSEKELSDFTDGLDLNTFDKIREFLDSLPKLYHKLTYTNSLGTERVIELTSLSDFFTWG